MASWKKVIVSGSRAVLADVTASAFSGDGSGLSGISADSLANALTVDNATIQLNSGTTFNGSAARTISIKDAGVDADALATILMLLDIEQGMKLIDSLDNTEALIIYLQDTVMISRESKGFDAIKKRASN